MTSATTTAPASGPGGARRLLALVSAIVFVDVLFYSAITPLLPAYADDLGLTKGQAGLLSGSYAAGTMLASLPAGLLALRIGVRPTLLGGLGLLALSCVAFGVAERYELLVTARLLQGVGGAGAWAAGLAWLTAVAPRERRGEYLGTALGTAVAGAIGGPVLGAAAEATSTALVFSVVASVAAVLAALVVAMPRAEPAAHTGGLGRALGTARVRTGAWLVLLPALLFGTLNVLVPLRLDDLGAGAASVAAVFLLAAAVEAAISPVVGRVSDRLGPLAPVRAGLLGVVVACVILPLPGEAVLLGATVVLCAALVGVIWAPAMAVLSEGAESAGVAQAIGFGIMNLAWGGGQVVGSAGGGRLAEGTGDSVPYAVLAVLAAATLALMLRRSTRRVASAA